MAEDPKAIAAGKKSIQVHYALCSIGNSFAAYESPKVLLAGSFIVYTKQPIHTTPDYQAL